MKKCLTRMLALVYRTHQRAQSGSKQLENAFTGSETERLTPIVLTSPVLPVLTVY